MTKDFIRGVFWVFVFKIFGAASLLLINILIAKGWDISTVGQFGIVTSSLMMAGMLSKLGLDTYVIKFGSRETVKTISKLMYKVMIMTIISSLLVSTGFYFFGYNASSFSTIVLYALFCVLPEILRALGNSFEYSFIRSFLLNAVIFVAVLFCFILDISPNFEILYLFASLFCLFVFFYKYFSIGGVFKPYIVRVYEITEILRTTIFMQISSMSIYFLGNFSVLILSMFYSDESVGKYFIVLQMTLIFNLVITSVGIYVGPKLSRTASNKDWGYFTKYYLMSSFLSSLFLLPVLFIYYIFGVEILNILFNINDDKTEHYLLVMSLGYFFSSLCGPKFSALNMTGNHVLLAKIMMLFMILGLALNFFSAYFFSINVFVYTTVSINVLLSLCCVYYVFKFIREHRIT